MDNITQGTIWWSLYTLITGKKTNKHFLLGALITNIPDLDIFVSRFIYDSPIEQFFFHRGIFHSIIFLVWLSFILGGILYATDKKTAYRRYVLGILLSILFGHLLIDGMTTYGMRYFLPRNLTTFSTDNIFVVDLGMWIIVWAGILAYLFGKNKARIAKRILGIGAVYFALSFGIQAFVTKVFQEHYPAEISQVVESKTIVEPLQIFLWRHVIKTNEGYYTSYYSLFDKDKNLSWQYSPRNLDAENILQTMKANTNDPETAHQITQILSFSRDFYTTTGNLQSGIFIQNMLMGGFNGWINTWENAISMFGFKIIDEDNKTIITQQQSSRSGGINKQTFKDFFSRVIGNK